MTVRLLDPDEWPTYRRIRLRALAADPDAFGSDLAREEAFAETDWRQRVSHPTAIAFVDDEPAAVGAAYAAEPGVAQIIAMWTAPEHRGRGLAGGVLDLLVADARERGDRIRLNVVPGNQAARRLYEARGFEVTGTVPERECFECLQMELR